jgi:hypothetical protein
LIKPSWWGTFSNCVKIIPRSTFGCDFVDNGWVSQQALKILAAALSENAWSMILDAKTLAIDHFRLDKIFDSNKRLATGTLDIYPVFEPSRQITNKLFGIDLKKQGGPGGVPFFFNNQSIREMIKYIETKTKQNFAEWFQSQGMLTEFVLYSGWVEFTVGMEQHYSKDNALVVHNICHSEVSIADSKLQRMRTPNSLVTGVHRNAWTLFSEQQKNQYKDFLLSRGLTLTNELL